MLTNAELAAQTLSELSAAGVRTLFVCPGGRNSPWIEHLAANGAFEIISHFDERAAGFAALGRARADRRAVAVLTTSGTAAGELLPAVMEACYTGTRLFLLTADRPVRFRGTGAPQSCEQTGLFGVYCSESLDWDGESCRKGSGSNPPLLSPGKGPIHWNVCFEEPQSEKSRDEIPSEDGTGTDSGIELSEARHPLVIVGELTREESRIVSTVLRNWGYPLITEALSQLSADPTLNELRVQPHRELWQEARACGYPIDSVIRIGGVPTHRLWRDLEVHPEASQIPVLSLSALPFSGLPRAKALTVAMTDLYRLTVPTPKFAGSDSFRIWRDANQKRRLALIEALGQNPASEPAVFRALSEAIPDDALVYLGNSLPIREWDLAAHHDPRHLGRTIAASRGLNGIDGQLSTFLGMLSGAPPALANSEAWAILGDLTTLYDSNAPWIAPDTDWHLAIIHNRGGRIFERVFGRSSARSSYLNEHDVSFEPWAQQWKLSYARIEAARLREFLAEARASRSLPRVIEIIPDSSQTEQFWKTWENS